MIATFTMELEVPEGVFFSFQKSSLLQGVLMEINDNCNSFVNDLVSEINGMYNNAVEYYTELSKKYAMIGFKMDSGDYVTSADIHFDAMQTIREQVNADLELILKRMQFLGNILDNSKIKIKIRDGLINFRILVRDGKTIREDLKSELVRYMDEVYRLLDDHLKRIERNLDLLEIDDLYMFQTM